MLTTLARSCNRARKARVQAACQPRHCSSSWHRGCPSLRFRRDDIDCPLRLCCCTCHRPMVPEPLHKAALPQRRIPAEPTPSWALQNGGLLCARLRPGSLCQAGVRRATAGPAVCRGAHIGRPCPKRLPLLLRLRQCLPRPRADGRPPRLEVAARGTTRARRRRTHQLLQHANGVSRQTIASRIQHSSTT